VRLLPGHRLPKLLFAGAACFSTCLFTPSVANACTPGPNSEIMVGNFQLVENADLVFVGTLEKAVGKEGFGQQILVKPTLLLKGKELPKEAYIFAQFSDEIFDVGDEKIRVDARKSDPFDLYRPHTEVWEGGCVRQVFDKGMQLVLFFKWQDGELVQYDPNHSRSAEDVSSLGSLWVQAVKIYADILKLPKSEQRVALNAKMLELQKAAWNDGEKLLLADDIERQLAGCGPIADFGREGGKCSKSEWVYNYVNSAYRTQPNIVSVKNSPVGVGASWKWPSVIMILLGLLAVALFIMNFRSRKALVA
jgi:hypothetical protein